MTIQQVLDHIDENKPNTILFQDKIYWLSETDMQVFIEVMNEHEGMPERFVFKGYNQETPPDTELLLPDVYADIYQHALARKIDLVNGEMDKYNANTILFNTRFQEFSDYWTRKHMPKATQKQFMF